MQLFKVIIALSILYKMLGILYLLLQCFDLCYSLFLGFPLHPHIVTACLQLGKLVFDICKPLF